MVNVFDHGILIVKNFGFAEEEFYRFAINLILSLSKCDLSIINVFKTLFNLNIAHLSKNIIFLLIIL